MLIYDWMNKWKKKEKKNGTRNSHVEFIDKWKKGKEKCKESDQG